MCEALVFGVAGAVLLQLDFPVAPILLGFVLGPLVEENFRRALLLSRGRLSVFVERPISSVIIGLCALLIAVQLVLSIRAMLRSRAAGAETRVELPSLAAVPDVE